MGARDVVFEPRNDGFAFTSSPATASGPALTGEFDLNTARLSLRGQASDALPVWMIVEFSSVVEFRDRDGDGRLGLADETVREMPLALAAGRTFQATPQMREGVHGGEAAYPLNVTGLDTGLVRIRFVVVSETTLLDGTLWPPEQVFIDVGIDQVSFARNDTRLALKVRQIGHTGFSASADAVTSASDTVAVSYRWSPCVMVGTTSTQVGTALVEFPSSVTPRSTTAFAFPKGESLHHISSAGLAEPGTPASTIANLIGLPAGDAIVFGVASMGAVGTVVATAWRRLRSG